MEQTDERLQHMAQVVADAIAREYNLRHGDKIPVPVPITYDLELVDPRVAGRACTSFDLTPSGQRRITDMWVQLNMVLFRDNVREYLNKVIPHEMAHLDQQFKDLRSGSSSADHGYVWQTSMRAMAQSPNTKVTMDTSKAIAAFKEHKAKLRAAAKAKKAKKELT